MAKIKNGSVIYHVYHGPGTITRTQKIGVGGVDQLCYVIDLVSGSQLMLPVEQAGRMCTLSSLRLSDEIREVLSSAPETMDVDYRQRRAGIEEKMNSGDPLHSAEVFRDLVWRDHTAQLSGTDREFMNSMQKRLVDILSVQADLDPRGAAKWLEATLQKIVGSWPTGDEAPRDFA